MGTPGSATAAAAQTARDQFRRAGMRWTPQRRLILEVLEATDGHVTAAELVDRCRAQDAETTPSTVYRTLRALEDIGLVQHAHGADGREEFHVRPAEQHGHLHCAACGRSWEIDGDVAGPTIRSFRERLGFEVDISHLSVSGRCATCAAEGPA